MRRPSFIGCIFHRLQFCLCSGSHVIHVFIFLCSFRFSFCSMLNIALVFGTPCTYVLRHIPSTGMVRTLPVRTRTRPDEIETMSEVSEEIRRARLAPYKIRRYFGVSDFLSFAADLAWRYFLTPRRRRAPAKKPPLRSIPW
ncbi:hypothetical protein BKA63DRAFT_115152 [Paraphoma chrysanthemicola]|nr:hypothetical protein BKA63DRAFT_115152 [Paraphoma chrysanthemicola]